MSKKAVGFLLIICFFLTPLGAQSENNRFEGEPKPEESRFEGEPETEDNRFEDEPKTWEAVLDIGQEKEEEKKEEEKKTETVPAPRPKRDPRIKSRFFEISLANINNLGFANTFIATDDFIYNPFTILHNFRDIIWHPIRSIQDPDSIVFNWNYIFRDEIVINLDHLFENGFAFDFGGEIKPLSINVNWKDKWGFGLDLLHIDATGSVLFPGELIGLKETKEKINFGVGAAVFADVGIPIFFHANEVKVKFRPAAYIPLAYVEPNITYFYTGTELVLDYEISLYTPLKFILDENRQITGVDTEPDALLNTLWDILNNNLGYDFNLGFEYPLYPKLDIGIDFFNIPVPFLQAKLDDCIYINDKIGINYSNENIKIDEILNGEEFDYTEIFDYPTGFNYEIKTGASKKIFRPFKMIAYGIWRPFETKYFTLIPKVGFSYNKMYANPAAFEGGLGLRLDNNNFSVTTLGIHYMDHKWKNSIDCILNLKVLQIDTGIIFQSQDFVQSWRGAGFAFNFGLKLGF